MCMSRSNANHPHGCHEILMRHLEFVMLNYFQSMQWTNKLIIKYFRMMCANSDIRVTYSLLWASNTSSFFSHTDEAREKHIKNCLYIRKNRWQFKKQAKTTLCRVYAIILCTFFMFAFNRARWGYVCVCFQRLKSDWNVFIAASIPFYGGYITALNRTNTAKRNVEFGGQTVVVSQHKWAQRL